jgi:predicted ATPase
MLTAVELKHFKNIGDQRVELGPLNVLVGRNGTGKSNFIDALRFLQSCFDLGLEVALGPGSGLTEIKQWSAPPEAPVAIALEGQTEDQRWRYEIELSERNERPTILRERFSAGAAPDGPLEVLIDAQEGTLRKRIEGLDPDLADNLLLPLLSRQEPFAGAFGTIREMEFYAIPQARLGVVSASHGSSRLDASGMNMARTLRVIQQNEPERFAELLSCISRIAENVDRIQVRKAGEQLLIEAHHPAPSPLWKNAFYESDGTLRALGLLAARFQVPEPSLIAFEEPELNLHPGAMGLLADVFSEAALTTQIILTTHSPDLIARFPVESLLVVEALDGEARIGPVEESQRQIIEEQLFSAGDLLRLRGGLERQTATDGIR